MDKFQLIKRNTAEILGEEELKKLLKGKKKPVVYLGTAITGSPHVAYFVWVNKLADFLKAGFKVKVLLADFHGALDGTEWDILDKRYKYYSKVIPLMFKAVGVPTKDLEFVKGSSFEGKEDYVLDLMKLLTLTSIHDANKASSEVVKQSDNPKIAGLVYPLMQALDEEYLGVDVQFGGLDQRKILTLAGEVLPKIGYKKRVHVMTPIIPGLIGKKMSASVAGSKVDLMDDEKTVQKKVRGAECVEGDPDNGLMAFLKNVIFTIKGDAGKKFVIERPEKFGGNAEYDSIVDLENDFRAKKVHPLDLKNAVAREINDLLKPIRASKDLKKLHSDAYD